VLQHLVSNANDTFLWVALVCQNLEKIPRWNTLAKLNTFPPGLDSLYKQMAEQIYNSDNANLCEEVLVSLWEEVLASITIVYRPVTLKELISLVEKLEDMSDDLDSLPEIIGLCGSFLTIRDGTVYFIHQSAKDYLLTDAKAVNKIFPSGIRDVHYLVFSRSLKTMTQTLQQDMYKLRLPGISINSVQVPDPDPLAPLRYPCVYWVRHFQEAYRSSVLYQSDLSDSGAIYQFFQNYFLYWLEAVSLIEKVSEGILAITTLESSISVSRYYTRYMIRTNSS
jgi:hypothetical protein